MANRPVDRLYEEETNMILPILGALLGSMIGVVVFVIVALITGSTHMYLVMGIGFLTAVLSTRAGGRGKINAAICTAITVLAVFIAPFLAWAPFLTDAEIYEAVSVVEREDYFEYRADVLLFKDASTEDEIREVATQFFEFSTKTDENNFVSDILSEQEFWLPIQLNPNLTYDEYKVALIAIGKRYLFTSEHILSFCVMSLISNEKGKFSVTSAVFLLLAALTALGFSWPIQRGVRRTKRSRRTMRSSPNKEEFAEPDGVEYLEEAK